MIAAKRDLAFPRFLICFCAISINFYFGERIMWPLLLNFLVCSLICEARNKSLMLSFTSATIFYCAILIISSVLPTLRKNPLNFIYVSISTNYLLHYFFWCLLEFDLLSSDSNLLVVCLHTSLPSLCCLIFTQLFCSLTGFKFHFFISFFGFITLRASLYIIRHFWTEQLIEISTHVLWNSFFEICSSMLFKILPVTAFIWEFLSGPSFNIIPIRMIDLIFLMTLNNLLEANCRIPPLRRTNPTESAKPMQKFKLVFVVVYTLSAVSKSAYLQELFNNRPYELCLTCGQALLFAALLVAHRLRLSKLLRLMLLLAMCFFLVLLLRRLPQVARIRVWDQFLPTGFSMILIACVFCCGLPFIATDGFRSRRMVFAFVAPLFGFYYLEWLLFQATILDEKWFLFSSLALVLLSFGLKISHPSCCNKDDKLLFCVRFTHELSSFSIHAPALTKLILVAIHLLSGFAATGSDRLVEHASHRLQLDSTTVIGIFMLSLGLLCGNDLLPFFYQPSNWLRKASSRKRSYAGDKLSSVLAFVALIVYFRVALGMSWHSLGILPPHQSRQLRMLFLPISVLLSTISVYWSFVLSGEVQKQPLSFVDPHQWLRSVLLLSIYLLTNYPVVGAAYMNSSLGLVLVLASVPSFSALTVTLLSISIVSSRFASHHFIGCLIRATQVGLASSCAMPLLFGWFSTSPIRYTTVLFFNTFSNCLSMLWEMRRPTSSILSHRRRQASSNPKEDGWLSMREEMRLKLLFASSGVVAISVLSFDVMLASDEPFLYNTSLQTLYAAGIFALGQMLSIRSGRRLSQKGSHHSLSGDMSEKTSRLGKNSIQPLGEHALITWFVNATVLWSLGLLAMSSTYDETGLYILFTPWLLFGLVGRVPRRNPKLIPLTCFTLLLTGSVLYRQYLYWTDIAPPLRAMYPPYARVSTQVELLLTISLIPVHLVFLADQSGVHTFRARASSTEAFFATGSHVCSKLCALVLLFAYILTPCCLLYLWISTSYSSLIYGLHSFGTCCYCLLYIDIKTEPVDRFF